MLSLRAAGGNAPQAAIVPGFCCSLSTRCSFSAASKCAALRVNPSFSKTHKHTRVAGLKDDLLESASVLSLFLSPHVGDVVL